MSGHEPRSALFVATVAATMGVHLLPHAESLHSQGWRVEFAAGGPPTRLLQESRFDYHQLESSRSPTAVLSHLKFAVQVRALVKRRRYGVVYVHSPIAAALTRLSLRTVSGDARPAIVYFAHGFHFLGAADRSSVQWLWYLLERLLSRVTDQLIVLNETDLESVRRWEIARRGRVTRILGVGVDAERFTLPTAQRTALGQGRWVVSIAEMTANKQPQLLVQALALLPADVSLAFAGEGPAAGTVDAMTKQLGLQDRVRQLGYVHDVPALLEAADVVTLVSRREGLPRSLMEALCAGRPVAVGPTRGSVDVARAGGCPVAADFSPQAIADAIMVALQDPRSPREIREHFLESWEEGLEGAVAAQVAELLVGAAHDRSGG